MDGRTRLAAGGFIAGSATIAAVAAVVMSNAAAFADSAGVALQTPTVIVRSHTPAPSTEPRTAPPVVAAAPVVTIDTPAEPAAAPVEAPVAQTPPADEPTVTTVATTPSADTEASVVAQAAVDGTWAAAYDWSKYHGWTSEQTGEWIMRLEAKLDQYRAQFLRDSETSGLDHAGLQSGLKKDRSLDSPDHRD